MTERSGPHDARDAWGSAPAASTIRPALAVSLVGHLLVLVAAVTASPPASPVIVAAIACSVIAMAGLTELAPPAARGRRVMALIGGHGVAAALVLAGLAPSVPRALPLAGLAAAAALGVAGLVAARPASIDRGPSPPLTLAPRVAAIALVSQALVQPWIASATGLSMALHAAVFVGLAALGGALLASLSIIALRVRRPRALVGLVAWTVGWVAVTADLAALIVGSLGGTAPMGPHQLRVLDAGLVQLVATAGGLVIGAALVTAIRDVRVRHSALVLLAGYAVLGLLVAAAEHRIDLATDFPSLTALRRHRDLTDAIRSFALGGVMWQCWRNVAASAGSRAPRT